jgi:hypothetical protein
MIDMADRLASALKGGWHAHKAGTLIDILPRLTHEQLMELRHEYKRLVKTGAERKGVNVAKHIRARLSGHGDEAFMAACYVTALGRWESEAYWANVWYQNDTERRELLIGALMGRTNNEIRLIKAAFRDKRYGDSLTKCMRMELQEDEIKRAVLMVLDEDRMEETDELGQPLRVDYGLVDDDITRLSQRVRGENVGDTESVLISIIAQRSDTHLKEVIKGYKTMSGGVDLVHGLLKAVHESGKPIVVSHPSPFQGTATGKLIAKEK